MRSPLSWLLLAAGLAALLTPTGCGNRCCNWCLREYHLGAVGRVSLSVDVESGDNCSIEDVPMAVEAGLQTVIGDVVHADVGYATLSLVEALPGDQRASPGCTATGHVYDSPADLAEASEEVLDTRVCVLGEVGARVICSEAECGGFWSSLR